MFNWFTFYALMVLTVAGYDDIKRRQIPNTWPLMLVPLMVLSWAVYPSPYIISLTVITAGLSLGAWRMGWLGGGDAKLLTVTVGAIGSPILYLLLLAGLSLGTASIAMLAVRSMTPARRRKVLDCFPMAPLMWSAALLVLFAELLI